MSKAAIVAAILRDGNGMITRAAANRAVDSIAEAVKSGLSASGRFALPGVGTLAVSQGAALETRNARTGKKIQIPAGRRINFVATNELQGIAASSGSAK